MAVSPKSRLIAVPSIALMSLAVLAGCGSSDSKDSSAASSSATTSSAAATTESSSAAITAESSSAATTESSSAASSSSSSSSATSTDAVIPAGYKEVTASKNNISFAVPSDWVEVDSAALANSDALQETLEDTAENNDISTDELKNQIGQIDLTVGSINTTSGEVGSINVAAEPLQSASLPNESEFNVLASAANVSVVSGEYKTVDTPLGKGAVQLYKVDAGPASTATAYIAVPSGTGSGYSIIVVSLVNTDGTGNIDALVKAITESVSKAS